VFFGVQTDFDDPPLISDPKSARALRLGQTIKLNCQKIKNMQQQKIRKQQDDRLLKRLSRKERRQQEQLRRMIQVDPLFKTI
jgi:hypothetical protein